MAGTYYDSLSAHMTTASTLSTGVTAAPSWVRAIHITPTTTVGTLSYLSAGSSTGSTVFSLVIAASTQQPDNIVMTFPDPGVKLSTAMFLALSAAVNHVTTFYST